MQVKQAVVGFGKAEKKQVMLMTQRLLHMKKLPRPDDAADALAIAICHSRAATSLLNTGGSLTPANIPPDKKERVLSMFYYLNGTVAHRSPYLAVIDCGGWAMPAAPPPTPWRP